MSYTILTEIYKNPNYSQHSSFSDPAKSRYSLREVAIRKESVTAIREAPHPPVFKRGEMPEGLDNRQSFCRLQIGAAASGAKSSIVVVGTLDMILTKLSEISNG